MLVEKQQSVEGLVLSRGGDVALRGEPVEGGRDFGGAHVRRVAHAVETDEVPNPIPVRLLGSTTIEPHADGLVKPVAQARLLRLHRFFRRRIRLLTHFLRDIQMTG